jgi:hypothetical protein
MAWLIEVIEVIEQLLALYGNGDVPPSGVSRRSHGVPKRS